MRQLNRQARTPSQAEDDKDNILNRQVRTASQMQDVKDMILNRQVRTASQTQDDRAPAYKLRPPVGE